MSFYLQHTAEQAAQVNAARDAWDKSQRHIAERLGMPDKEEFGGLMGNAATVPLDAWRRIDSKAVQLQRALLVMFNRFAQSSTTPVDLGDIVSYFPKVGDSGEVNVSMDGRSKARADIATVTYEGTPVPLYDSVVRVGWRHQKVLAKGGLAMDEVSIANSQRRIAERMESLILNGEPTIQVNGAKIYGLRTLPTRYTTTTGQVLAAATGPQWLTVIGNAVKAMSANNVEYGGVTVFVNFNDWLAAGLTEFAAGYSQTISNRIMAIPNLREVVPVPSLAPDEVIAVAGLETGEWGSILSAMPMTTRAHARVNPEDDYVWSVITAVAPQFRADANGKSKVVHLTRV